MAKVGRELRGTGGGNALSLPFSIGSTAALWAGSKVVFGRIKAEGGGGRRRGAVGEGSLG